MSVNKHLRTAWVAATCREAVKLFHEARKREENAEVELTELARRCANTAFQERADSIPLGTEEVTARQFMAVCREKFSYEIGKALAEKEEQAELVC